MIVKGTFVVCSDIELQDRTFEIASTRNEVVVRRCIPFDGGVFVVGVLRKELVLKTASSLHRTRVDTPCGGKPLVRTTGELRHMTVELPFQHRFEVQVNLTGHRCSVRRSEVLVDDLEFVREPEITQEADGITLFLRVVSRSVVGLALEVQAPGR